MKIHSRCFGEVEVEESAIINFPAGIPAFREYKDFALIPLDNEGPFFYLQSVRNENLCLVLADPFVFFPDYHVEVPDEELEKILLNDSKENISLLVILTIPEDFTYTTANLLAPVIINIKGRKAFQYIPGTSDYAIKHRIFPEGNLSVQEAR